MFRPRRGQEKLQGDPNQKLQFQMAVTLLMGIFDPPMVKPKCVSGVADFFENCKQRAETEKNPPLLKPILVFTTHGLGCIFIEI